MDHAMQVIKDLVRLRDQIREQGDLVTMSALEEFGVKYVQAIQYVKKSVKYEGEPVSVLLIQLDSADERALEEVKQQVVEIVEYYHNVDVFVAKNEEEAEIFWRDRHRLSAITRRTSGFKINEDVVIPTDVIPEFSNFIEGLNLYYLALAYRKALQQASEVEGIDPSDSFIDMELRFASQILKGEINTEDLGDQEFELQIHYFFRDLCGRYPKQASLLQNIGDRLFQTRIMVANHMHAGDGNCHVNIPVKSNYPEMLRLAEEAAKKVFTKVLELQGSVSGEHGIGITKIGFLAKDKIEALKRYKQRVDPKNILNPGKLTENTLAVNPYTFSFNRLIEDLQKTSFPQKEKLIELLKNIQTCSRCGKCKQVCPMYYPEEGFLYHPRNKIISLGALIEALYYTQLTRGQPGKDLLKFLQDMLERCTACGKCTEVCPVKINMPEQIINMRSFLEEKSSGGHHPIKNHVLHLLSEHPAFIPRAAKVASLGQTIQNKAMNLIPESVRHKFEHPFFKGYGPGLNGSHLHQVLGLDKRHIFAPSQILQPSSGFVFYFPGCGADLFYHSIGLAGLSLLLKTGTGVILPDQHMCCGYPLLVSGCLHDYESHKKRNIEHLQQLFEKTHKLGIKVKAILTSCGTCREALATYQLENNLNQKLEHMDVLQFLLSHRKTELAGALPFLGTSRHKAPLVYHAACHSEWTGQTPDKSGEIYAQKLQEFLGIPVHLSPGCCGESGLGALTSPKIYNVIRERKQKQLRQDFKNISDDIPVVVGCPSCKIGLSRILANEKEHHQKPVLHTLEYMAQLLDGPNWQETVKKKISQYAVASGTKDALSWN
jgi:Fe-S oxidoreductase